MKKRTIITSVLVIILCLGLISGSTFALFTSESKVNIAVTSGKVNVVATLKELVLYSATANTTGLSEDEKNDVAGTLTGTFAGKYYYDKLDGTTFTNGGTATLGDPANVLTIDKITPGDKVAVKVDVKNNSNVAIQYRVRINVLEDEDAAASYKLFKGLNVKIGETTAQTETQLASTIRVSEWTLLAANTGIADIPVEIYLPLEAGNEYQDLKTKLLLTVEAVQGNANTSTLAGINAILKASSEKNATMYDAIQELAAHSYSYDDLKGYVWSADNDLFYAESDVESSFEYRFFKAYTEMPSEQTFSIYADPSWNTAVVNLTVGFDAGEATGITTVTYDRSTATTEQDVVIRTNSTETTVTVNAPKDVVKHYGTAGVLSIVAVAGSSYHEYGRIGFLDISTGHIALEKTSEVSKLHFNATQETSDKVFKEIVVSYDKSLSNKLPEFSRDDVEIPEGGKLVVELVKVDTDQQENKSDFIWLTKQGIFEQIKVSDNNESLEDAKWADDDNNVDDDTQLAAQQIANNIGRDTNGDVSANVTVNNVGYTVTLNETTRELEVVNTAAPTEEVTTEVTTNAIVEAVKETGLTDEQKNESKTNVTTAVARIDNVYYVTLTDAITAAKADDVIVIIRDFTSEAGFEVSKNITIDTDGKTITVTSGENVNNRAFKVTSGKLKVYGGGTIDAKGAASSTTGTEGTGCYGAFRAEVGTTLELSDLTLKNYRPWGLNVKVLGANATLDNVKIVSVCGGGIEVTDDKGGEGTYTGYAKLTNCTMSQSDYRDWCSAPVAVSGNSKVDVYSTKYTGEYGVYVFSSGGTINIFGGEFKATSNYVLMTSYDGGTYGNDAIINVYGGTFEGPIYDVSNLPHEFINIYGGTFDHDPTKFVNANSELVYEDSVYKVNQKDIALIGTKYYKTIKDAVEAAEYGDTIYLLTDLTADSFVIGNAYYEQPCVVDYLKRGITFDGQNHTITFAKQTEETNLFAQMAGTLKNVTLENMNASIICDGYIGAKFENVTTKGKMNVDGNCGAFVIYVWAKRDSSDPNTFTFKNCVADVDMIGTGTASDYNAAFVGYMVEQDYRLIFDNCVNKGDIVCGSAGLFLANVRTYTSTIEIINCSNEGKIHRTYVPEGQYRVNQLLYGTVSDWDCTTIINGVSYTMAQVKSREAETAIAGNPLILGAKNETLALTKNDDGTFSVTASNNENVAYYVVEIGLYTSRNSGGSNRNYISEKVTDTSVKTIIKDLKFVDSTWMTNNNVTTTVDVVVGENTYKMCTVDNVDYYLIKNISTENLSGAAVAGELYSVSAYSATDELISSTGLTINNNNM